MLRDMTQEQVQAWLIFGSLVCALGGSFFLGMFAALTLHRHALGEDKNPAGPDGPEPTKPRTQAVRTERELDPDYDPRRTFAQSRHDPHITRRLHLVERAPIITEKRRVS